MSLDCYGAINNPLPPFPAMFGGRLTSRTNSPIHVSENANFTDIFYTPHLSDRVPVYDGTNWSYMQFTELSIAMAASASWAQDACFDLFLYNDSGVLRLVTGPMWINTSTVTITIASPGVVSWTGHGLHEGSPVIFTTTGNLPTGLTAGTVYYVSNAGVTGNAFSVSTSVANARAGASNVSVNTSGSQDGTHTATNRDSIRGASVGTTELTRTNGILMNANMMVARFEPNTTINVPAQRATYVGTIRTTTTTGTSTWETGGLAANGDPGNIYLWNNYNRVLVTFSVKDSANSWTYQTTTYRCANNSVTNRVSFITGQAVEGVSATYFSSVAAGTGSDAVVGVMYNYSGGGTQPQGAVGYTSITPATSCLMASIHVDPTFTQSIGYQFVQACEEEATTTNASTFYGDSGGTYLQTALTFLGWF